MNEDTSTNGASLVTTTQGFGTATTERSNEIGTTALAAKAKAEVQAPYIVAMERPRDWDMVRTKIMKDCARTAFAATALYRKPIGGGKTADGLSIRFAETAMRCMGNLEQSTTTYYDDENKRILKVAVKDLENNISYSEEATIEKTVERSTLKDGQTPISSRINSYGKTTFLVSATQDELLNKANSAISKCIRNQILRILPADIKEDATALVWKTRSDETKRDPNAMKKKVVDAFIAIGVQPVDLKAYLGRELEGLRPEEIEHLRSIKEAIVEGETTWKAVMESKGEEILVGKAKTLKEKAKEKASAASPTDAAAVETKAEIVSSPDPEPGAD